MTNKPTNKEKEQELTKMMTSLVRNKKVKGLKRGTTNYVEARTTAKKFVSKEGKTKGLWKSGAYESFKEVKPTKIVRAGKKYNVFKDNKGRFLKWEKV